MKLEERLRHELERSGRSAMVGEAPSVDELAGVAGRRQRRNRVVGSAGAAAVAGVLLVSALVASRPGDEQIVVADGGTDVSTDAVTPADDATPTDEVIAQGDEGSENVAAEEPAEELGAVAEDDSGASLTGQDDSTPTIDAAIGDDSLTETPVDDLVVPGDLGGLDRVLQGSPATLNVSTRESAVEFAGGSGVLLVASNDGYRGLATSFADDGGEQIGLSSINGLDWVEIELTGIPDGATATTLRSHGGGYVALFDRFEVESGAKQMFVGTSPDLAAWELSAPLEGFDVVATDLAVGSNGVMVIGDGTAPDIWFGSLGGPYARTGQLEVSMLFGVTSVDDEFLVAGRSADTGVSIFRSPDGKAWERSQLAAPGDGELSVSVADGTIVVMTTINDAPATVVSSDAGVTWELLSEGELRSLSVNGSTLGYLDGANGDASITLTDGDSFAQADLDVAAPDRLALLSTTADQAVMLVNEEGGGLTWVLASR